MSALQVFMDRLTDSLENQVPTTMKNIGPLQPYYVSEIPAVTIALDNLSHSAIGVGGKPKNLVSGALEVELNLDLANPVITFPDESVNLMAADRLSIQIPHKPLVDINGSQPEYIDAMALNVEIGSTSLAVVSDPPGAGECRLETATGKLKFSSQLATSGTLRVRYLIGEWEVESYKFSGDVSLSIYASGADNTEQLSQEVAQVLGQKPQDIAKGLTALSPVSWGPVMRAGRPSGKTKIRSLSYSFTFDHEIPIISTGGGPIRTIDVRSTMGPEQFLIT